MTLTLNDLRDPTVMKFIHRFTTRDTRLLDVGCGAAQYREACPGSYTGVDISNEEYRDGIVRSPDVIADATALPFANATFDVIMYGGIAHQFPHPQSVFDEARRVASSNGRLLVFDYTFPSVVRLKEQYQAAGDTLAFPRRISEWREILQSAGWRNVRVQRWSTKSYWRIIRAHHPMFESMLDRIPGGIVITAH